MITVIILLHESILHTIFTRITASHCIVMMPPFPPAPFQIQLPQLLLDDLVINTIDYSTAIYSHPTLHTGIPGLVNKYRSASIHIHPHLCFSLIPSWNVPSSQRLYEGGWRGGSGQLIPKPCQDRPWVTGSGQRREGSSSWGEGAVPYIWLQGTRTYAQSLCRTAFF